MGILGKPSNPPQLTTFFFTMNRFYNLLTTFFWTMNSFDFKLAQDRQTNTGDSGEAPQPSPTNNIFWLWTGFIIIYWHGTASLFARASRSQKENTPRPSASELFTFLLALRAHKKPGANFLNFETCVWGVWGSLPTLPNLQYFFWLWTGFIIIFWQHFFYYEQS